MIRSAVAIVAGDERSSDRQPPVGVDSLAELARRALSAEGVDTGELGLRFVDELEMARLNFEHMGRPGPTDVLAFPIDGAAVPVGGADSVGDLLIGDVVICPSYAAASGGAGTDSVASALPEGCLELLVVHGVLHLLGYDHADEAEAAAMRARERRLLASCATSPRAGQRSV